MPKIWIRPSQRKISYENFRPVQLIFDLIQPPRVTLPGTLSRLTILDLAHNCQATRASRSQKLLGSSSTQIYWTMSPRRRLLS